MAIKTYNCSMTIEDMNAINSDPSSAFYASYNRDTRRAFRGCPLGRGASPMAAMADLIERSRMESGDNPFVIGAS